MATLACRNDLLVQLLNEKGYHPIVLPRSNLIPPDLYIFDDDRLMRWGPLATRIPTGSLPLKVNSGKLAAFEHKGTSTKHAKGAASFLESALKSIGVSGTPKVDLSVASGEQVAFSFEDTVWNGVDPSDVASALQKGFDASVFPAEQLRLGMVHVAYEYAYAGSLLMTIGDKKSGSGKLTAAQIDGIVDVGAEAHASLVDGSTVRFTAKRDRVAFACKVGQIKPRKGGGWNFYAREIPGLGATAEEGAERPYMLLKGAVLVVEDLQHDN
jgi:hypothetical protein